ncbi:MAG TPA: trypsin-like peptidase domain-containing protein [Myxococcota bacterium]|nr:trypsin-like peptidase domain-containing protein [Myxococcota bacterium]HRY94740.1 trypsin-like peptidase domain-containing protein [Myxococcota bacterium]HSA20037.1 trypsin-like peptidase domain-containing protein [Myxococcota bacterium]
MPAIRLRQALLGAASLLVALPALAQMSPRQIYQERAPATVLIVAAQPGASSSSAGTGSILGRDGLVATNCHVIWDAAAKQTLPVLHVFLKPERLTGDMNKDLGRHFSAEALACDPVLDLALLRIKAPPADLAVMPLGDPEEVGPGDDTAAIGMPEQGGLWTITTGRIGNEFQDFKGVKGKHVFQTETSLNRGNSGGPLLDTSGRLIGVNTSIARQGEGGLAIVGINFALKASVLRDFAAKNRVQLAYAPQLGKALPDTAVAMADKPAKDADRPADKPVDKPADGPADKPVDKPAAPEGPGTAKEADKPADGGKVLADPDGKGTLTVEDDPECCCGAEDDGAQGGVIAGGDEGGEEYVVSRKDAPAARRPDGTPAKRFEKGFRMPPRPYSFSRLFTSVDAIRGRSGEAFNDLEEEMKRLGWE